MLEYRCIPIIECDGTLIPVELLIEDRMSVDLSDGVKVAPFAEVFDTMFALFNPFAIVGTN